ncbi:hypothetical protein DQ238_15930 [Geodermatophilus sp. TF02-6]|uniref:DUF2567 domain-containing protein n=1 Tax=Geodermatophilus sp. TF02-6 TaxID=2250575 RepID=UPI000DE9B749|nr:DUF2567 domain-containing protein [Geodermatophilus sp. TF02-6]RBY77169.1 hypothetical protein DQ238_15930 [Geodermatophilus sp. TF02-6]
MSSLPVPPQPVVPARWRTGARWPGRAELRADLRGGLVLTGVLLVAGLPAGLLWEALAPRAQFEVTADGPTVVGHPSAELLVADDGVYTLVLAGLGLLAGVAAWQLRRRRGVATLLGLAAGTLLAALAAWQLGQLLGAGPTAAELADVGARVTTAVRLHSLPALAVGPFVAVLTYVVAALFAPGEDLDRPGSAPAVAVLPPGGPLPAPGPVQGRPPAGRRTPSSFS